MDGEGLSLLGKYLADRGIGRTAFARQLCAPGPQVSLWADGWRKPGLKWALEIDKATDGAVPASYWITFKPRRRTKRHAA